MTFSISAILLVRLGLAVALWPGVPSLLGHVPLPLPFRSLATNRQHGHVNAGVRFRSFAAATNSWRTVKSAYAAFLARSPQPECCDRSAGTHGYIAPGSFATNRGAAPACAAPPAYTLAARVRAGYRPEISVRVNGAGPFWCTLDSGAGRDFVVDTAIGKAAGLRPTSLGRSFGEGPDSNVDEIASGATLQVDKLRLPHQRIRMHSLEDGCIFGTKLLDRFVVEIDYLTPEIRLFAADGYLPPTRAVKLPLAFDGTRAPDGCCTTARAGA
jgi:hypothetical protein